MSETQLLKVRKKELDRSPKLLLLSFLWCHHFPWYKNPKTITVPQMITTSFEKSSIWGMRRARDFGKDTWPRHLCAWGHMASTVLLPL